MKCPKCENMSNRIDTHDGYTYFCCAYCFKELWIELPPYLPDCQIERYLKGLYK